MEILEIAKYTIWNEKVTVLVYRRLSPAEESISELEERMNFQQNLLKLKHLEKKERLGEK